MIALSYLSPSPVLIRVVLDESPSYRWMAFTPTSLVGFTQDWLTFFVGTAVLD
jgi:hypothetical protein